VRIFARHSGQEWLQVIQERRLVAFFQILRQKGLPRLFLKNLCMGAGAPRVTLGLVVFAECHVEKLGSLVVSSATATQLEVLLLEMQRKTVEYGALARLHASLADRVDEIGGHLAKVFYEEVALQCLNTHHYRSALQQQFKITNI